MTTLVVGAGAMGRWVGSLVPGDVAYTDTDPDAAAAAASATGGRVVQLDHDETFEAVCLAVPMAVVREAIATHAPAAERAIFDVTGEMTGPVEAMRKYAPDRERVSFHPLFAPENAPGNVPVVADVPGPVTDRIRERMSDAGNTVFETTVREHDEAMSTVQAKAHAAILAYALTADEVDERFHTPVSTELTDLIDQVVGGEPHVYANIQQVFDGADDVADAARLIADADAETFVELYEDATTRRTERSTREDT
ncbi:prephenate dehydrogenase [Haloarchaeobius sp. TZWWS8]|uniref:prephenate dehydrogenase n=1 Tax=Haloarchaeobius sp. TZWWS8 TaxID=3446121 RepID=UPI003EBB4574